MRKYQLSGQYYLTTHQDIGDKDNVITRQFKQGAMHGLFDTASGECLIINETMHSFLKHYETPKTLDEVAQFFADTHQSTSQEVYPIVEQFFKEMKSREVLIAPKTAEKFELIVAHPVGTLIDGYRIEENLSVSLPLEVYKATDVRDNKLVILKMLRIPTHLSEQWRVQWREHFKKEFVIQQILRGCSGVCQLLNLTPEYAVLEWIEGVSLRSYLSNNKPIDGFLKASFLSQTIDSYAFIHSKNILHGDVHASNILVTESKNIKIIDFDLAHQLTDSTLLPSVRGGAPEFIPPENINFDAFSIVKGKANYRTEVYQIGVIAYWITYGQLPFSGDTWQELATNILNKPLELPDVNALGEKISLEKKTFLEKCLVKNPKKRFVSAVEMLDYFKGKFIN